MLYGIGNKKMDEIVNEKIITTRTCITQVLIGTKESVWVMERKK